jgi:hypothetical protein
MGFGMQRRQPNSPHFREEADPASPHSYGLQVVVVKALSTLKNCNTQIKSVHLVVERRFLLYMRFECMK